MNYRYNVKFFLLTFFNIIIPYILVNAQTVSVQGKVTSSRYAVQNAEVIFTNTTDSSKRFSAVTDESGNYAVNLHVTSVNPAYNLPSKFVLEQNYPNPFSSQTAIPYELNVQSEISVTIYDILGREVRKYSVGVQNAGMHNVLWDGRNGLGQQVANGVYFYKLQAGGESHIRKMIFSSGGKEFISLSQNFAPVFKDNSALKKSSDENEYTVTIANKNNTVPVIISQVIEDVLIQNDTTINFNVDNIPLASINSDSVKQHIRGFGAANIIGWRPDMTESEVETAFGTGEGQLGFTLLRLRISPNPNDFGVNVATAKKAYDMGAAIVASPWTPPASMKTNNSLIGGELREDSYDDYAEHLNSFVEYMADNGVPIYAVSVQNEPDIQVNYESCDWTAEQMVKFMAENAPAVGTKVMAPESFQFRRVMSDPVLNDSAAAANLDIVAGHIYGGGLAAYPLAEQKGKEVWMTEHLSGENAQGDDWTWALEAGKEISNVMNAGMNAYIWWYIVRFYGPLSDGTQNAGPKGAVTKKGYVMSQFSRFIRPGYYRINCETAPPRNDLFVTSYTDSAKSKIIIVAINTGSLPMEHAFRMNEGPAAGFISYTTTQTKNCERGDDVTVTDGNFSFTLEPRSITTFISE